MGAESRPSRQSKVVAMARVSHQQRDEIEYDPNDNDSDRSPQPRRRRARPSRVHDSDDDEDHSHDDFMPKAQCYPPPEVRASRSRPLRSSHSPIKSMPYQEQDPDYDNPPVNAIANPHRISDSSDDDHSAPDNRSLPVHLPLKNPANGVRTKSGRVSKPQKPYSPTVTPQRRRPRDDYMEPQQQPHPRYETRSRKASESYDMLDGAPHYTRTRSASLGNDLHMKDDDDEVIDMDTLESPVQSRRNGLRNSRVVKMEHLDIKRPTTRSSSRNKSADLPQPDAYHSRLRPRAASNGVGKSGAPARGKQYRYRKDSEADDDMEADADGDGDYPSPNRSENDSDEPEDPAFDEVQDLIVDHAPRRTPSRRARKTQPRRTVPAKRKRSSRSQPSSMGREARKSYRPKRGSMRPADFYNDNTSSDESSSDASDIEPRVQRPRRAAATRAGDAIAKGVTNIDFFTNSMAVLDSSKTARPKKISRYASRRNRMSRNLDQLGSDAEDGPPSTSVPIEPIQVDLNLSWKDIGGLDHHIRALKEMVFLPLVYPEVFEKFNMEPPKGVLFYGPPGTGKTLCARALAASCGASAAEGELPGGSVLASTQRTTTPLHVAPALTGEQPGVLGKADGSRDQNEVKTVSTNPEQPQPQQQPQQKEQQQPQQQQQTRPPDVDMIAPDEGENGECQQKLVMRFVDETKAVVADDVKKEDVAMAGDSEIQAENEEEIVILGQPLEKEHPVPHRPDDGIKKRLYASDPPSKPPKKKPRVAFFMRNGADCLSKWVGEAERQLRMTFEAAKKHQPAIIFFDEIDGLAPVRSSKQDQIHSSIVSTLLGLMDGLDARGKIVVIGATNRVDAIDPALRRPGRFDRELIFTLPNVDARRRILDIHTSKWKPPPNKELLDAVSKMTVGYCGADLKSLCSEAAIRALRRRYPQIYESQDKLLIDVDQVKVSRKDFFAAMQDIVPASHRSARTHARPLPDRLTAVLTHPLQSCIFILKRIFPQGLNVDALKSCGAESNLDSLGLSPSLFDDDDISSSDEESVPLDLRNVQRKIANAGKLRANAGVSSMARHHTLRPRLLICGQQGLGQAQLGPALLHFCESCPVHAIDFPSLHSDVGTRSPEEALISAFREAARSVPAVLYLPHLHLWWESASESLRTSLIIALKDLPSDLPVLVLATAEVPLDQIPSEVAELFADTHELSVPSEEHRRELFSPLVTAAQTKPRLSHAAAKLRREKRRSEVLPKAPLPPPKPLTADEETKLVQSEDRYIRTLRMEMRAFVESVLRDKRFKAFWNPVDPDTAPDYYSIIKVPMDVGTIAKRVDSGSYPTLLGLVNDFDIMVRNAIQYNPPSTETGAAILRRAHGLIDIVHAWVDNLNPALVETCNKIIEKRIERMRVKELGKESEVKNKADGAPVAMQAAMQVESSAAECVKATIKAAETVVAPFSSEVREEEEVVEADSGEVAELEKLLLDVSTGMTVDGLEGLYVRCEKVVHLSRRSLNRDGVVKGLLHTVQLAREDPALVGKLLE